MNKKGKYSPEFKEQAVKTNTFGFVYDKRSSRVTWNQLFCVTTMEGRILEKIRRSAPTYG
ncbi:hypothetical protein LEP1GSC089_0664 [Leptospira interrogans serovar Autumnalis str. LP101]|nr:hypothetical protein LEP1GSC089_0664 [Leptospira interrogans serovar Autumnalis str. LP101]